MWLAPLPAAPTIAASITAAVVRCGRVVVRPPLCFCAWHGIRGSSLEWRWGARRSEVYHTAVGSVHRASGDALNRDATALAGRG